MNIMLMPALNAVLNSASACLLVAGYFFIRRGKIEQHKKCMLSACVTSILFLASYLTFHALHGSTRFQGTGWVRPVYFTILISHTILAMVIVPYVILTLVHIFRDRPELHRRRARVALPLWLYVSVTGVVIYLMLYQMPGGS